MTPAGAHLPKCDATLHVPWITMQVWREDGSVRSEQHLRYPRIGIPPNDCSGLNLRERLSKKLRH